MTPPAEPDRPSIFARARQGEPVLDDLVAENLPMLRAFVRAHMAPELRNRETDGDLLQSVCASLLADRGHFDFRGEAQFRAWMFTAARNKMLEKLRFHRREQRDPRREVPPGSSLHGGLHDRAAPTPSQAAAAGERARLLEQAIDQLSPEHREVVTLTQFAGLSASEAAEHLERSPDAVRMLLGRAMACLSRELKRLGFVADDRA